MDAHPLDIPFDKVFNNIGTLSEMLASQSGPDLSGPSDTCPLSESAPKTPEGLSFGNQETGHHVPGNSLEPDALAQIFPQTHKTSVAYRIGTLCTWQYADNSDNPFVARRIHVTIITDGHDQDDNEDPECADPTIAYAVYLARLMSIGPNGELTTDLELESAYHDYMDGEEYLSATERPPKLDDGTPIFDVGPNDDFDKVWAHRLGVLDQLVTKALSDAAASFK